MIDRFAGMWQFGRLYSHDIENNVLNEAHPAPEESSGLKNLFHKMRTLFFLYQFDDVLSFEQSLLEDGVMHPEFWGLLGHAHIWKAQGDTPFTLNTKGWKKGLSFFERGLEEFPDSRLLAYDRKRALGVLSGPVQEDLCVQDSWEDTYLSLYLAFFYIHLPLVPDGKRDPGTLFSTGSLPDVLHSMGINLLDGATCDAKRKAAVLAVYDIFSFQGDHSGAADFLRSTGDFFADESLYICARLKSLLHDADNDVSAFADEAGLLLEKLAAADPDNPLYFCYSAELFVQLDKTEEAEKQIARGKELYPDHEELQFIGSMLAVQQSFGSGTSGAGLELGKREVEKALAIHPYRWESYELAGSYYFMAGDYDRAVYMHKRLLHLRPWYFEEFLHFAEILLRLPPEKCQPGEYPEKLKEAVSLLSRYEKIGDDREYAASLRVSALAKLYYYYIQIDKNGAEGESVFKEIQQYLDRIGEDLQSNAEFLAYAGFELYVNRVPELGEGMVAGALAREADLPYALQSYGVIIEDRAEKTGDASMKLEALHYFKRAVDSEKDHFTKGRYLLYLVDFLNGTELEHLSAGHLRRGLEDQLPVPELYDRMADEYIRNSRDSEALEILEQGRELFPGNEELTFRLGKEFIHNGDFEKGIEELISLTRIDENNAFYWNQLGISYVDWGNHIAKPEEANAVYSLGIDAFNHSIELMPGTSLFWGNCGDAYRMTGDYEHALEFLDKAASMAPDDPFNFYALGKVYWEKGLSSDDSEREEHVRNSEYSFRKAQSLAPENVRYIKDMGDMYFYFGYFNEAADSYRKAVEMEPENPGLYDAVGLSCYHLGEFNDAVEWFSTSLEYTEDTGEILNSIGLCYFEMGNFEKAQNYFKQASDTDPQNSVFLDNVFLTQYKILGIGEYPHGG